MKKALGVVSFGTSDREAEESCIFPIERTVAKAFPEYEVQRAFTSRLVGRIKRGRGDAVENETELLRRLRAEGYEEIALVATHVIPGGEYEKLLKSAEGVSVSEALLSCEDDEAWMAGLLESIAAEEQSALLVMGHGSDYTADEIYLHIQWRVSGNVFVACVKGERTLESVLPELERLEEKKIVLMPLMLVAGEHAKNDLAGDGEDSWKSILTQLGFDVRVRLQGLGELRAVQQRYVDKARRMLRK